ncbi:MAG: hypothetical protein A2017_14935 [Lentisphaerae bacterium GWF2_44_16]|nr:MAG: hypothetical protein A2017_14935 [Lentisphaerae bacterium GWF2_44_16]
MWNILEFLISIFVIFLICFLIPLARKGSLKSILFLLVFIALLPSILIITYIGHELKNYETERTNQNVLGLVNIISANHKQVVSGLRLLMETLALLPDFQEEIPGKCAAILARIYEQDKIYGSVFVSNPDGDLFAVAPAVKHKIEIRERKYYVEAIKTKKFSVGESVVSKSSGLSVIHFAYPFLGADEKIKMIIGVSLAAKHFDKLFKGVQLPQGTSLNVFDGKGALMYGSLFSDKAFSGEDHAEIFRVMSSTKSDTGVFELKGMDGIERLYGYSKIRLDRDSAPYIYFNVGIPYESVQANISRMTSYVFLLLVIAFVLALLLAWGMGNTLILSKISEMISASQKITQGDFSARINFAHERGDFARLAKAFDEMAGSLESRNAEQNETELKLRESNFRNRQLFESNNSIMMLLEPKDGSIVEVNPAAVEFYGFSEEEFYRMKIYDLSVLPGEKNAMRDLFFLDKSFFAEFSHTLKSGEIRNVELRASYVNVGTQKILHSIIHDITERKKVEAELKKNLEFLQIMIDVIPNPIFCKNKQGKYNLCNSAFEKFFGKKRDDIIGHTVYDVVQWDYAEKYHQMDIDLMRQKEQAHESGGEALLSAGINDRKEKQLTYEARLKNAEGVEKCIFFRKVPYIDNQDNAGMIGIMFDITDIKSKEEDLNLITAALEAAASAVVITDIQAHIIWANYAFADLSGYSLDEVIGKKLGFFKSGLYNSFFYKALWDTILSGKVWHGEIINKKKDGAYYYEDLTITPVRHESGKITHFIAIKQDISSRKKMEEELMLVHTALEGAMEAIITTDMYGKATYLNKAFSELFGYKLADLKDINALVLLFQNTLPDRSHSKLAQVGDWLVLEGEGTIKSKDGKDIAIYLRQTPIIIEERNIISGILSIITDITDKKAERERQALIELQLRQAQKLEAIGQLAAGIAHELNTPIQFVGDNVNFLHDSFKDIISLLGKYHELTRNIGENAEACKEMAAEITSKFEEIDFDYLSKEIPLAIEQSLEGIKRISDIVVAMKDFSHPGSGEKKLVDVNKAITNTVTVARNEWKYVADIKLELAPDMHPVPCYEGEFKQVVLNILVNASHAIGDALKKENSTQKGTITVKTANDGEWASISISDTGTGIPEGAKGKVFDPFFTTKETSKGTGQGLAISYDVIVNKHKGKLYFETEINKGTTFFIRLPMKI